METCRGSRYPVTLIGRVLVVTRRLEWILHAPLLVLVLHIIAVSLVDKRSVLSIVFSFLTFQAVTLHWVMFEKAMGMNAADLCEALLAHALRYFEATVHVVPDRVPHPHTNSDGEKSDGTCGGVGRDRMMIVGNSELICAARQARALHGMLMTIHEVRCTLYDILS